MLIKWLRKVELSLLTAIEYPIFAINILAGRAVRALRRLQDSIRRAI